MNEDMSSEMCELVGLSLDTYSFLETIVSFDTVVERIRPIGDSVNHSSPVFPVSCDVCMYFIQIHDILYNQIHVQ